MFFKLLSLFSLIKFFQPLLYIVRIRTYFTLITHPTNSFKLLILINIVIFMIFSNPII